MLTIKNDAPEIWLLVKVPQITNCETNADRTPNELRDCIRGHLFGGDAAKVRKLTEAEKQAVK